jgi:dTDP-4-amino-4,6-dideoxygalactose transaminase
MTKAPHAPEVPFLAMKDRFLELRDDLQRAYDRVMDSGQYILGDEVSALEQEFAAYCGAKACIGVANGLDALVLSLLASGVGRGDEVLVPANTYIATWLAVSHCGATAVPVEPGPDLNIDPAQAKRLVGPRTKAVLPVHLYGLTADMAPLLELAQDRGLAVVEDAAQAHGATYHGKRAGNLGGAKGATGFSFYPTKNLGAFGDAGAVVTNDPEVADRIRLLRNYGSPKKDHHVVRGYNSRLDPLQAAFLRAGLQRLDAWNRRRDAIARIYFEELQGEARLALPLEFPNRTHVWHQFVIRHPERDRLRADLQRQGVHTLVHYPIAPHEQPAYRAEVKGSYPLTERLAREMVSLPMNPYLSDDQALRVCEAVRSAS